MVSFLSPWDLVVGCARLQAQLQQQQEEEGQGEGQWEGDGTGLVRNVLEHFLGDYEMHSSTLKPLLVTQVFSAASQLHM